MLCLYSNPACSASDVCDGDSLYKYSQLQIRLNTLHHSAVPQNKFIIINACLCSIAIENHRVLCTLFGPALVSLFTYAEILFKNHKILVIFSLKWITSNDPMVLILMHIFIKTLWSNYWLHETYTISFKKLQHLDVV